MRARRSGRLPPFRRRGSAGGLLLLGTLLAGLLPSAPLPAQQLGDAAEALRTGEYEQALEAYRSLTAGSGGSPEAYRGLVRALVETGGYQEAEEAARRGVAAHGVELANTLGEVLRLRGDREGAEAAFRDALAGEAPDAVEARLNLAVLRWNRGERDVALEAFDGFIDLYNRSRTLSAGELTAVGTAVRYLGRRDPVLFRDALKAYDEAVNADPDVLEPRVLVGELFLEKYNSPDARASFEEVLRINPNHARATLGLARALDFDGEPGAMERAERALEVNPSLVDARVFLARLHLGLEDEEAARREAERALEVNPASLEALSMLAAAHYLGGDRAAWEEVRGRILALDPAYGELYTTAAELAVRQRRYRDAVELAREAIRLDPRSWEGYGILGINQLREGAIEAGRSNLETAFEGDPYNVWFKNTLDLLDTFARYETVRTPHFELFLDGREAELLAPYVREVAERAWSELTARYGYAPPAPVRIELFPSHADFSVRTVGLAGLGALGVSFGPVLAMDSPAARSQGEFNWASTLWHEIAHTLHLGMTDHRVPRWFSEGLAVHEQRKASPGWGHQASVGFLQAYDQGRLLPVSELNEGFVRPRYPQHVIHSYYQASLVFEMIEQRWGYEAILGMLRGYGEGRSTAAVVESELGLEPDALDEIFDAWLGERFRVQLAAVDHPAPAAGGRPDPAALARRVRSEPGDFLARLTYGRLLREAGNADGALEQMEAARTLFPDYGGPDGPDWTIARILRERGDLEGAAEALERLHAHHESHYEARLLQADVLEALGERAAAVRALEGALEIHPYAIEVHERLAALAAAAGDHGTAVRERRAVLALDPPDRAGALYELARAHWSAGDGASARETVLQALEIAPSFDAALELLLEIRGGPEAGR